MRSIINAPKYGRKFQSHPILQPGTKKCVFEFQILTSPNHSQMKIDFKKPRKAPSFPSLDVGKSSKNGKTFFYWIFGLGWARRSQIYAWLPNLTSGRSTSRGPIFVKMRKNRKCDFPSLYIIRLENFQVTCYIVILANCNPAVKNRKKAWCSGGPISSWWTYLCWKQLQPTYGFKGIRGYGWSNFNIVLLHI